MGQCLKRPTKIAPTNKQIELLLTKYNIFITSFLYSIDSKKRHLSVDICKRHRALHDEYHMLRTNIHKMKQRMYDTRFEHIHNRFINGLLELYETDKLIIDKELESTIQQMFHLESKMPLVT